MPYQLPMQSVKRDFMLSPSLYSNNMISSEATGMNYFLPENPSTFPANFGFMENDLQAFELNRFLNNIPNYQTTSPPVHEFTPNSSSISNNSTSDEADNPQHSIVVNERKQRRMISNRESARRSRMRKQKHLDELWSQVILLKTENHNLVDKLNHVSERHDRILQENASLKEEASDLREMVTDLQLAGTSFGAFRELGNVPCNITYLTTE